MVRMKSLTIDLIQNYLCPKNINKCLVAILFIDKNLVEEVEGWIEFNTIISNCLDVLDRMIINDIDSLDFRIPTCHVDDQNLSAHQSQLTQPMLSIK